MIQEEQRRALILKSQKPDMKVRVETAQPEKKAWTPIIGIDNSYFDHTPKKRLDQAQTKELLQYYLGFDARKNNDNAATVLKCLFKTSYDSIRQFAQRTQVFVLRQQFKILLENYADAFQYVVEFANSECLVCFEPESEHPTDLISSVLHILNNQ